MRRSSILMLLSFLSLSAGCTNKAEDEVANFVTSMGGKVTRQEGTFQDRVIQVDLRTVPATDSGLKLLAKLKKLRTLYLGFTQVTDAGMKELAPLDKLRELDLGATKVTDAGLKDVAQHKKLTTLFLGCTQVTDEGLKELAKLERLQYLDIASTKATKAGIAELQAALPNCKINHSAN
jgi:internalin A